MRTKGAALGTATNWALNFMVVEITPIGIQTLGWRFYIIWTVLNFAFVPTIYLFYPETSNRTLEDIDRYFRENNDVFVHNVPDAIATKRPTHYVELEQELVHRNASISGTKKDLAEQRGSVELQESV